MRKGRGHSAGKNTKDLFPSLFFFTFQHLSPRKEMLLSLHLSSVKKSTVKLYHNKARDANSPYIHNLKPPNSSLNYA